MINGKNTTTTYNERYYKGKFEMKKHEVEEYLKTHPGDLVAKQQIDFINDIMSEGAKSDEMKKKVEWNKIWHNWEAKNFMPFNLYDDNSSE